MDRILPLLFTLLPMAGMAVPAKKKKKDGKQGLNGDSDVIVQDTGTILGSHTGKDAPGIDVNETGVGKNAGDIPGVVPDYYLDNATNTKIHLTNALTLLIKFGNGRTLTWDAKSKDMVIGFGHVGHKGKSGKPDDDNHWQVDGEHIQSVDLTVTYTSGQTEHKSKPTRFDVFLQ